MDEQTPSHTVDFHYLVRNEKDVFKLTILGFASIEDAVDDAIAQGFGGTTPPELKRLLFRTRLALFSALTTMPKKYAAGIQALAQVRHDFAHGRLTELSPERGKELGEALKPLTPDPVKFPQYTKAFESGNPRMILVAAFTITTAAIEVSAEFAEKRRQEERSAVRLRMDLKRLMAEHEKT